MPDYVSISYRGATYALGQGPQFYGIWYAAATQAPPLESWPLTPEGWTAAWSRFASVEVPSTIAPVTAAVAPPTGPVAPMTGPAGPVAPASASPAGSPVVGGQASWSARAAADPLAATRNSRLAAALIGIGLALGIAGLFPDYLAGTSLASQPFNVVPHAIYLAAWTLSGVLILLGGARLRAGALLGLGLSAVTLGLFVADVGTPAASGAHLAGAGLVLSILGWLGCTAGAGLAAATGRTARTGLAPRRKLAGRFGEQPSHDIVPLVTLVLAAIGAAIAFVPSWDRFTLQTAAGASQTVTAGNAFANPGPVIFGDVLVMIAIVVVVVVAALWRPLRFGAALALGAAIPLVAQAISAIVQITSPFSPQQFGISSAQASRIGLTIDTGLTAMFWVYCAFLGTLLLLCVWMLLVHGPEVGGPLRPSTAVPAAGGPTPGGWAPGGGFAPGGGPTPGSPEPAGGPGSVGGPAPAGGSGPADEPEPGDTPESASAPAPGVTASGTTAAVGHGPAGPAPSQPAP